MRPLFCLALAFVAGISAQSSVKPSAAPAKGPVKPAPAAVSPNRPKPTIADARTWIEKAEKRLLTLGIDAGRADWIAATYIIDDSEILSAQLNQRAISATVELVKEADRFNGMPLPEDIERKIKLLKLSLTLPAPSNEGKRGVDAHQERHGRHVRQGQVLPRSRAKGRRQQGWLPRPEGDHPHHGQEPQLRRAARRVGRLAHDLAPDEQAVRALRRAREQGRKEIGFEDTGALWRANYDMTPDAFENELERLWEQVKPLYDVAPLLRAREAPREVRRRVRARRRGRSRRTCSATCGRRSGRTSTRSSSRPSGSRLRPDARS